ncbi:DUF6194 family protein [Streptomyces sp. NPDC058657]|uniref:DUF6194 family protein n=1 Tax=unclassified Streptomyces TaxID=2593676 RepID=UPI00365057DB
MSTHKNMGRGADEGMEKEQILATVRGFDGALVVDAVAGGDFPELVWGDAFFYYAPDGVMPRNVQPYATVVTKNYPGDDACDLDPPGRWRLNIQVGTATFRELTGEDPRALEQPRGRPLDHAAADRVMPHPVYGTAGWIAVVNPAGNTSGLVVQLLRDAHEAARARFVRRHGPERLPGAD